MRSECKHNMPDVLKCNEKVLHIVPYKGTIKAEGGRVWHRL